ncbi:metal-sensitive transcriptional regulator [Guggenheimella bovis]
MTDAKKDIVKRLRIISGHLQGVIDMIEGERACDEILIQVQALSSSLAKVKSLIVKNYLTECFNPNAVLSEDLEKILKYLDK